MECKKRIPKVNYGSRWMAETVFSSLKKNVWRIRNCEEISFIYYYSTMIWLHKIYTIIAELSCMMI